MPRTRFVLICLLVVIFSSGCASTHTEPKITKIETTIENKKPNQSIIIGKINGKATQKPVGAIPSAKRCSVKSTSTWYDDEGYLFKFSDGELFSFPLDPGEYKIICAYYEYLLLFGNSSFAWSSIPIGLSFSVGESEVIYIGNLNINYSAGELGGTGEVIISDDYDAIVKEFRGKYPNIKQEIKKEILM